MLCTGCPVWGRTTRTWGPTCWGSHQTARAGGGCLCTRASMLSQCCLKTYEWPITAYKHKDDLKDITAAFALDQQGTITQLLSQIKEYMDLHPELATNPCLQALFMKVCQSHKQCASVEDSSANGNPPPCYSPSACTSATCMHGMWLDPCPLVVTPWVQYIWHPSHRKAHVSSHPCSPWHPYPITSPLPQVGMAHGLTPAHRGFLVSGMLDEPNLWYGLSYVGNPVHPGIPSFPLPLHLTHAHMAHGLTPALSMVYTKFVPSSSGVPLTHNPWYAGPPPSSHPSTDFYCSWANPSSAYSMHPEASRCAVQYH